MKESERGRREIGFLAVIFVRFGVGVMERLGVRERRRELCAPHIFLLGFCAPLPYIMPTNFFRLCPVSAFHKRWVVLSHFRSVEFCDRHFSARKNPECVITKRMLRDNTWRPFSRPCHRLMLSLAAPLQRTPRSKSISICLTSFLPSFHSLVCGVIECCGGIPRSYNSTPSTHL